MSLLIIQTYVLLLEAMALLILLPLLQILPILHWCLMRVVLSVCITAQVDMKCIRCLRQRGRGSLLFMPCVMLWRTCLHQHRA